MFALLRECALFSFPAHPVTDSCNKMATVALALTASNACCSLVLRETSSVECKTFYRDISCRIIEKHVRLKLESNLHFRGVERNPRCAHYDVESRLLTKKIDRFRPSE